MRFLASFGILICLIVASNAYSYVVPPNPRRPGVCIFRGMFLKRGENHLPSVCQIMYCNEDGSIQVEGCGHRESSSCRTIDPANLHKSYPECCKVNELCAQASQGGIESSQDHLLVTPNRFIDTIVDIITKHNRAGGAIQNRKSSGNDRWAQDQLFGGKIRSATVDVRRGQKPLVIEENRSHVKLNDPRIGARKWNEIDLSQSSSEEMVADHNDNWDPILNRNKVSWNKQQNHNGPSSLSESHDRSSLNVEENDSWDPLLGQNRRTQLDDNLNVLDLDLDNVRDINDVRKMKHWQKSLDSENHRNLVDRSRNDRNQDHSWNSMIRTSGNRDNLWTENMQNRRNLIGQSRRWKDEGNSNEDSWESRVMVGKRHQAGMMHDLGEENTGNDNHSWDPLLGRSRDQQTLLEQEQTMNAINKEVWRKDNSRDSLAGRRLSHIGKDRDSSEEQGHGAWGGRRHSLIGNDHESSEELNRGAWGGRRHSFVGNERDSDEEQGHGIFGSRRRTMIENDHESREEKSRGILGGRRHSVLGTDRESSEAIGRGFLGSHRRSLIGNERDSSEKQSRGILGGRRHSLIGGDHDSSEELSHRNLDDRRRHTFGNDRDSSEEESRGAWGGRRRTSIGNDRDSSEEISHGKQSRLSRGPSRESRLLDETVSDDYRQKDRDSRSRNVQRKHRFNDNLDELRSGRGRFF